MYKALLIICLLAAPLLFAADADSLVFQETDGLVAGEAEHFSLQTKTNVRQWYVFSEESSPGIVAEIFEQAVAEKKDKQILDRLTQHYYDIREGVGVHKSPEVYGAFPTDPYSHTPSFSGVQQPGMTGQVKEDILSRFMELGVSVNDGALAFSGELLKAAEFLDAPAVYTFYDQAGEEEQLELEADTLAFTLCQVPVVYHKAKKSKMIVQQNGRSVDYDGLQLDTETSSKIFNRTGEITKIDVYLAPAQ